MSLSAAVAAKSIELTAFFFGRPPRTALAFWHRHEIARDRFGGVVHIVFHGHRIPHALIEQAGHFNNAFPTWFAERYRLAGSQFVGGLDWFPVNFDLATFDRSACGRACLEKSDGVEPNVNADSLHTELVVSDIAELRLVKHQRFVNVCEIRQVMDFQQRDDVIACWELAVQRGFQPQC